MSDFDNITTRGGDQGETSLLNGERRRKDDLLFLVLGDLDELSSYLGLVKAGFRERSGSAGDERFTISNDLPDFLEWVQKLLIQIGGHIASPTAEKAYPLQKVSTDHIDKIEKLQRELMDQTDLQNAFILPGGSELSAWVDVSRSVARRLERGIVTCIRDRRMRHLETSQVLINRLSDFLFVLARWVDTQKER